MRKINCATAFFIAMFMMKTTFGQDPSFSQFFSSPLNVNPALTANINGDWRMISNLRDEWIQPASPYATGTLCFDKKIFQENIPNVPEKNVFGIGGMLMYDYAMGGIVKGTYASLDFSYNIKIAEDAYGHVHRLGIGVGVIYGHRYVDFSRLNFQEQFVGTGFNTNMPTGEAALSNMKSYISSTAGLLYTFKTEKSNFDFGVAAYHLNKPKQTFLEDPNQFLPMRKVIHSNFETFLNDRLVLNANGIYQEQGGTHYFSIGSALGYYLDDDGTTLFNVGLWYWSNNAIIPYVGFTYQDLQLGLSYDATVSKLDQSASKPSTFELSLILRGNKKPPGIIPCPWK
ncbi:MAG TPA: PorP/SprF family type IX secretion system membrane protein [Puia sp.]|nr:PorP/SprF family type IX secretion system membrane protein [Puia sp.]